MSHRLGIQLPLPTGTAQTLEQQRSNILSRNDVIDTRVRGNDSDNDDLSSDEENSKCISLSDVNVIEEDDRIIMPFRPSGSERDPHSDSHSHSSDGSDGKDGDSDNNDEDSDSDSLSLTPPPTMPILRLNLEKLCGYRPSSGDEMLRITNEIRAALLGSGSRCNSGPTQQGEGDNQEEEKIDKEDADDVALDFIARSRELFEAGIARHDTTTDIYCDCSDLNEHENASNTMDTDIHAIVPYPEFLPLYQHETQSSILQSTQQIWKHLLHPHKIDVVQQILTLLTTCSRDLIWKYQMNMEIRHISRIEQQRNEQREAQSQIRIWRRETRPKELAKLYDVRETFELRLHASRSKYDMYVKEREIRVQRELRRRRENGSGTGGIAGLDWDGKITFAFDEDGVDDVIESILQERRRLDNNYVESEDDDDGYHHNLDNDGEEEDGNESESFDDSNASSSLGESSGEEGSAGLFVPSTFSPQQLGTTTTITSPTTEQLRHQPQSQPPLPITSKSDRKKRRAAAATKRLRKKLLSQKEAAIASDLRSKIEAAYAEEKFVRNLLISNDEKFAHATVLNLEQQMEKVDELIESLQEEEWKDEEEGLLDDDEEKGVGFYGYDNQVDENEEEKSSILNSILAMILSAIPLEDGCDSKKHYSSLKEQHESIVARWKKEFGRLPPMDMNTETDEGERERERRLSNNAQRTLEDSKLMGDKSKTKVAWDDESLEEGTDDNVDADLTFQMDRMKVNGNNSNENERKIPPSSSLPSPPKPSATAFSVPDNWEDEVADDNWDSFFPQNTFELDIGNDDTIPSSQLSSSQSQAPMPSLRPGGRRR